MRLALALMLLALPAAAQADSLKGVVGVCIRWGADPAHVADAVVVDRSKSDALNEAVPTQVKGWEWPRPAKDYNGEWVGVNLAFDEATPPLGVPNCRKLNRERAER